MKYRIVQKSEIGLDAYGDKYVMNNYYPQYKLWGLFWIAICNAAGYKVHHFEEDAQLAIKRHAKLQEMKERCKTRIIYVDDDCLAIVHTRPGVCDD